MILQRFEDFGLGLAAVFEDHSQEIRLCEQSLKIRIENLRKLGLDTSVEEAALVELRVRSGVK